ncbi:Acyltransferase family protein [Rubripirellula tenax]|uniref:Acyltransferase family protein n=1 Tax=Rubripirellula tenax TaxID=2528015 RepID=A0A5C6F7I4_9BACT|nr:acyltransferase [Rubripirellula tenax]TWU56407.1 Acyltransferase family protein [Rubripirellula tenax]
MSNDSASSPSILKPHRRIVELDSLRALAAINLVLFHFTLVYANKYGYSSPLGFQWPFGAYGVEMFFILSGFVNSMSLLRRGKPVDFVAARLIRIVPVFLLVIIANLWILPLAPMQQSVTLGQFVANMTLLPRVLGFECVDPVMWTLQIEMMFYVTLVTLFMIGGLRRYFIGWGSLLAMSITFCPLLDSLEATYGGQAWFSVATGLRRLLLLDFAPLFSIGFLLYMIKTGVGKRWQNIAGIVVAAIVFHCIDHGKHNPVATVMIIGLVTLCAYGKVPPLRFRPLVYISTISYAIYLCHNNLGCALIRRFDEAGVPPVICFAIAVVFSFALAVIITHRVEQPITNALRRGWVRYRNPTAEVAAA